MVYQSIIKGKNMGMSRIKLIYIYFLCYIPIIFVNLRPSGAENRYIITKPYILHTSPPDQLDVFDYNNADIFVDSKNQIIVICNYNFLENNRHKRKSILFICANNKWTKRNLEESWDAMVINGIFHAVSSEFYDNKDKRERVVSFYGLREDGNISSQPTWTIKANEKIEVR